MLDGVGVADNILLEEKLDRLTGVIEKGARKLDASVTLGCVKVFIGSMFI